VVQPATATVSRYDPARRRGLTLHISALALVLLVVLSLLSFAIAQPAGVLAILALVLALLLALLLPLLFYRLYSLIKSGYWISREGVQLRWGLRQVDLPYAAIVDVARVAEIENPLQFPRWIWPGAVAGEVENPELGTVEFLAAERDDLVLIGSKDRVFAVSPQNAKEFVATLKREQLRGSLRPLRPRSVSPSFVFVEVWARQPLRLMILGGALLAVGLLILAGIIAPGLPGVSLGFNADGSPLPLVAGVQLFLLPALNLFFYMGNLMLGLLFYREEGGLVFSTMLWGASLVSSVLFLGAIIFSL
jgi:hypothetical protein